MDNRGGIGRCPVSVWREENTEEESIMMGCDCDGLGHNFAFYDAGVPFLSDPDLGQPMNPMELNDGIDDYQQEGKIALEGGFSGLGCPLSMGTDPLTGELCTDPEGPSIPGPLPIPELPPPPFPGGGGGGAPPWWQT